MLAVLALAIAGPAEAAYVKRYATVAAGALTYTGNTLGLDKRSNQNNPGTSGAIGAFASTTVGTAVGTYPAGTTLAWASNSSAAVLTMPAGSKVLYAELIWAASYNYGGQNVSAQTNNPVTFITPSSTLSVSPDAATSRTLGNPLFYVRSADVTAAVKAAGAGTYTVGAVPGTVGASENNANVAGWTLAVAYGNSALPTRNLTIFVGAELTNGSTSTLSSVSGFCTPQTGAINARLLVSAMEGDASITGDQMQFGPSSGSLSPISGPRNPSTNFFAGQITDNSGNLSTTGTFGNRNHAAGAAVSGARQGWDIVNVDVSSRMVNGQSTAYARGTSTGDQYVISTLGLQIDVGQPSFPTNTLTVNKPTTFVGDTLTYTVALNNSTGTADATSVVYTSTPPQGTSFVPGSVTVGGVAQPAASTVTGVNVGTVAKGASVTLTYQVRVDSVPLPPSTAQYSTSGSWTYQFASCPGYPLNNGTSTSNAAVSTTPRLLPTKAANTTAALLAGQTVTYTITVPNSGTGPTVGATLRDPIPSSLSYVPGSTTLNGAGVADGVGGTFPFAAARTINSPGQAAGDITVGAQATITFQATVNPSPPSSIQNIGYVDPDGGGPSPEQPAATQNPLKNADLTIAKTDGLAQATAGQVLNYAITVTNLGPDSTDTFTVYDPVPAALLNATFTPSAGSYNAGTGVWSGLTLGTGQSVTLSLLATLDPLAFGTLTNSAYVFSTPGAVGDSNSANNSSTDTDSIIAQADLAIVKDDGVTLLSTGGQATYTLTVTNNGPSTVSDVIVTDSPPAQLTNLSFTPAVGFYNPTSGLWSGVNLAPGKSIALTVVGDLQAAYTGTLTNTATVAPSSDYVDLVAGNNTSSDTDTVTNQPLYSISGKVYADVNHNSIADAGETGTGVTGLYAKLQPAAGGNATVALAANATTGAYQFNGILAGNYTVILDDNATLTDITPARPAGWVGTQAPAQTISVAVVNISLAGRDFGLYQGSSVAGRVFLDNGAGGGTGSNGIQDGTEIALAGATVKLTNSAGTTTYDTLVTAANGDYLLYLPAAAAGQVVRIVETNAATYNSAAGVPGTTAGTYDLATDTVTFTNATGTAYTGANFGDIQGRQLSGSVYNDANHNGTLDGGEVSTNLAGLFVKLQPQAGGNALQAVAVDQTTGAWSLFAVAGNYNLILDDNNTLTDVTAALPAGWVGTERPAQTISAVPVTTADIASLNYGLYQGSKLSGLVFVDDGSGGGTAGDGLRNGTEDALAAATLRATNGAGTTTFDTATSAADGTYTLYLPSAAGGAAVKTVETNPTGYVSVSGVVGTTAGAYVLSTDTTTFTFATGTSYTGVNFGDVLGRTISGRVYLDADHSASLEPAENGTGLAGLVVKLLPTGGGNATQTALVDPTTGAYSLLVAPGTYNLILDDNATLTDTTAALSAGWFGTEAPSQSIAGVAAVTGDAPGFNFGLWHGTRVSGRVFEDNGAGAGTANNGIQDGGELGLPTVAVTATNGAGALLGTTTTSATGDYDLWVPYSAGDAVVKLTEQNLGAYTSIGGVPGTTGGAYDRATDTTTFTTTLGSTYAGANFADVKSPVFALDNQRTALPGSKVVYQHTFTAGTAGTVQFALAATPDPAAVTWSQRLLLDLNLNGAIDPQDPPVTGPITVAAGQVVGLLLEESVPINVATFASDRVAVTASFNYVGAAPALAWTDTRTDLTQVSTQAGLTLTKAADKTTAQPGQVITYTLTYTNGSNAAMTQLALNDVTPAFTTFVSAAYGTLPADLTGCTITVPAVGAAGQMVWTFTGSLAPGSGGTVTYAVRLTP